MNGLSRCDDLAHFLFDGREVFRRERLIAEEIIEEAVLDHRANGHLRSRIKLLHRFGQHMGAVMADEFQRPLIIARDNLQRGVGRNRIIEINQHAIDHGGHGLFFQ